MAHDNGISSQDAPGSPLDPAPSERAARIYRELRAIYRDLLKRRGDIGVARGRKLDVRLQIEPLLDGSSGAGPPPERRFADQLLSALAEAIDAEIDRGAPFPAGRARCYWCESFDCEHAAPSGPRAIFGGYSPTGVPLWPNLGEVALSRRDPRIEDLYREVPLPITLLQSGSELVSAQLPEYGQRSGAYRVLAQLAVGYLSLPVGPRGEHASLSLTVQVVEVDRRGHRRLHLNILGRLPDRSDAGRILDEEPDSRLADAFRAARTRLAEINRWRRHREPRERLAMATLERLARNVDRIFRQHARRTKHAQDRHRDRERPAAAALRDAKTARPEEILRDVRESTWVVLGPRSRVHIFNDSGQHITSVVYPGETVRRRTAQGMWKAMPPDSVRVFREAIERSAGQAI